MRTKLTLLLILPILILASCGRLEITLPRGFAIIYGVADYAHVNDLLFSDNDAEDLYALLTSPGQGFAPEDVILRVNSEATKDQLNADFSDIAQRIAAHPNPELTRFVFYFAGHGYGDGRGTFPEPWDSYFTDPQYSSEPAGAGIYTDYLFLHGISIADGIDPESVIAELQDEAESDDDLANHLATISSRQKMVIIDACHSGGFIGDGTAGDSVPPSYDGDDEGISFVDALRAITLYAAYGNQSDADIGPDTVVLAAAGEQEYSYEYSPASGIENGVFTHYFLEAHTIGDANFDGYVTLNEAYSHAVRGISSLENRTLFGDAKFVPRRNSSPVDFVIFRAP